MQVLLRFLVNAALALWLGSLTFFAFALAPTAFHLLPSPQLAGRMIAASITELHRWGLIAGAIIFLANWFRHTNRSYLTPLRTLLVAAMLGLTAYSQYAIIPTMESLRQGLEAQGNSVEAAPPSEPRRHAFDVLHHRSEQMEGAVLVLGVALLFFNLDPDAVRGRR